MGQKIQFRKIFYLIFFLKLSSALALTVDVNTSLSMKSLTTEMIWTLEPEALNPALKNWAVNRSVTLQGIKTYLDRDGKLRVSGGVVHSKNEIFLRELGPWFKKLEDFSCYEKDPLSLYEFQTSEGALFSAYRAAQLWEKLLENKKNELEQTLSALEAREEASLQEKLSLQFSLWLYPLEEIYQHKLIDQVRSEELDSLKKLSRSFSPCKKKKTEVIDFSDHHADLEKKNVFSRAVVKSFLGYSTIKAELNFGKKNVLGQFLVDTRTWKSTVDPYFLKNQVGPLGERILKSGDKTEVFIPNFKIALQEFPLKMLSIDLFRILPKEGKFNCCEGVIGLDLLRLYPFHFTKPTPQAVVFYDRESWASNLDDKKYEFFPLRLTLKDGLMMKKNGFWISVRSVPQNQDKKFKKKAIFLEDLIQQGAVMDVPYGRIWFRKR